jgi:ATP-binding cassette, subfamily B, beta-glucan exporter
LGPGSRGLLTIGIGVLAALHADRLSHVRRVGVMAAYFEHVLHLPMTFHAGSHSGRLLKIMIEGSSAMASVWLSFFREHCATFVALTVLLPLTLFVNPVLGAILIFLVLIFGLMMNLVMRRTEALQSIANDVSSDMAERVAEIMPSAKVRQHPAIP